MTDEQFKEIMDKLNELSMQILALHRNEIQYSYSAGDIEPNRNEEEKE